MRNQRKNRDVSLISTVSKSMVESLEARRMFSTYTVNAAGGANYSDLETAIVDSPAGSTLLVSPGTYTAHATSIDVTPVFWINKALTLISTNGAAATVLSVPTGSVQNVLISASNVRVEGFTLQHGEFCADVQDFLNNTTLSNETLKNLNLTPDANSGDGHGILYEKVTNSIIADCNVGVSYANGIMLDNSSSYDTVENCTVAGTVTQHALAIKNSDHNQLLNNTVLSSFFDGIIVTNGSFNRITGNNLTNFNVDGICVTSTSDFNYVALNTVNSTGEAQGRTSGVGIWLNDDSDGNTVYANAVSGSAECGIDIFVSSDNLIQGNDVFGNYQGGIFVFDALGYSLSTGAVPTNTVIRNNYIHGNPNNSAVILTGAINTDVEHNYVAGTYSGVYGSSTDVGLSTDRAVNTQFVDNDVVSMSAGVYVNATTVNLNVFNNRFINVGNNYAFTGATVKFDDSVTVGGNYWSDQVSTTPYTKFVFSQTLVVGGGGYIDNYPFANEAMNQLYTATVTGPIAGTMVAAGSTRAITWTSTGSTLVDIYFTSSETGDVLISKNRADTGVFVWNVPTSLTAYSDYAIKIVPKTALGLAEGTPGVSGNFSITNSGLTLLSPGANLTTTPGASMTVSWISTSAGTPVDVQFENNNGAWTTLASSVTDDFAVVTLPNVTTDQARIRVVNHSTGAGDEQDGYFRITATAGIFSVTNQLIASTSTINWLSPAGSVLVDVDFFNGITWQPIATQLPDIGHVNWFVPEMATNGASIRIQFYGSSNTVIATAVGNPFNIQYTLTTGVAVPDYRAYNPVTHAQLFTSQLGEYTALGQEGWDLLGARYTVYSDPVTLNGIAAVPNYRLYNPTTQMHYWTTDRESYFGLIASGVWKPIGVVNYEFNSQVSGSIPLYRSAIGGPPLIELWTTALQEYDVLPTEGWTNEGVDAYVFPA